MSPIVADYIAPLVIIDTSLKLFKNWRKGISYPNLSN